MRRTPTSSGARPRRPTWPRPSSSPPRSTSATPGKLLAYNCSPSFNWRKHLSDGADRGVPARARGDGLPVPVHHARRVPRAQPLDVRARAAATATRRCPPTSRCRSASSHSRTTGYTATRHQREVGAGYFDQVMQAVSGGLSSTLALHRLHRGAAVRPRRGAQHEHHADPCREKPVKPDDRCTLTTPPPTAGADRDAGRSVPTCTCPEHCDRDHEHD